MALTAAERQRRHRQKLRAEGKLPQKSSKKSTGKSKNEAVGQKKWVMRLLDGGHRHGQPQTADATGGVAVQETVAMSGCLERRSEVVGLNVTGVNPHIETDQQSEGNAPDFEGVPQLRNMFQPSIKAAELCVEIKQEPVLEVTSSETGLDSMNDVGMNPSNGFSTEQDFMTQYNYHSNYLSVEFIKAQEKLLRKRQGNAERQRRRRKRMKEEGRYELYKQKHVVHCEKHRATKREIEKALPESLRREFIAKRREDGRRRVAQHRARKKQMALEMQTALAIEDSLEPGIQEPSGTGAEELRRHAQRESLHRRFASWRNKKKLTPMSCPDGEMENDLGLPQTFVLCESEPAPHESTVAAFNPGVLPCKLVKCHTSAPGETVNPALSEADRINLARSQATMGRTGKVSQTTPASISHDHHVASTSSLAPYIIIPSQTDSSGEGLNTRTVAEASQHDEPSIYPAAEVVPRYITTPPIWPSSRPVTEGLPQVVIHGQNQPEFNTVEPMEANLSQLQTDPGPIQTHSSQPISIVDDTLVEASRHHQVLEHPDRILEEETPDVLQEDLRKVQSQFPMVHNYVKKLHSDIRKLREANRKLTQRKIDLNELKTNNHLFQHWTGLPDYNTFEDIFVVLKPSLVPTPCKNFVILSLEEEFFYVLSRMRTGIPATDLAERIGISEVEYNLIFHRWIMALPHKLQYFFKTRDERARTEAGKPSISYDEATSDYKNVLIDCSGMFPEEVLLNCGETPAERTELCKFIMGVSFPTEAVVHLSDDLSGESGLIWLRVSRRKSDIMVPLGERDSWLVQGQSGQSPVEKILSRVRSLKIIEDSKIKIQCQTFRSVVKVCLLLSNIIQDS